MTTPPPEATPPIDPGMQAIIADQVKDERKRRLILGFLLLLLFLICLVGILFIRYATKPEPIPEILPEPVSENIYYPPTYLFSITEIPSPTGVGVSPDGQRIYTTESADERLIKMFDRDGKLILSFAPPGTTQSNRKPSYIAVDQSGRVFVSENYNQVIDIFTADGEFIDSIIGKDMTLSKFVTRETGSPPPPGTQFFFNNIDKKVYFQLPGKPMQSVLATEHADWAPLGLRFSSNGDLLVTNIVGGKHSVVIFPAASINGSLTDFSPQVQEFGEQGDGDGQFSFPNSVVTDSQGMFYVSDGNNSRISIWTPDLVYKTSIGKGSAETVLSLPRGLWMDSKDQLHVVDSVGQIVKVFDVTGVEPVFLYSFGDFGDGPGQFNYPSDIAIDASGRVYVTDRENNQLQIWSY